ncbi:hypothetical protein [Solimonas soli]|uniref:hypothetical protein n=1 Tax=Solimonas soli TaxID=413479 RepID=UPI00048137C7|nr:hypothetical protein [Solimonas soli]
MKKAGGAWRNGACVALLLFALPAGAEETVRRFYGYAYDAQSGAYAYTEVHAQRIVDGRWHGGSIDYYAPDGTELGHKTMSLGDDPYVVRYRMDMRGGYGSAISDSGDPIVVTRTEGGRTDSARIAKVAPTCADAGFHLFLRDHFAQLQAGETLRFQLVAAQRLASYKFRAMKVGEDRFEGRPVVVIRLEPDSLLRVFAGTVEMRYAPDERELMAFRGPSNVVNPATGKPFDVRVVYATRKPADAPRELPPLQGS